MSQCRVEAADESVRLWSDKAVPQHECKQTQQVGASECERDERPEMGGTIARYTLRHPRLQLGDLLLLARVVALELLVLLIEPLNGGQGNAIGIHGRDVRVVLANPEGL